MAILILEEIQTFLSGHKMSARRLALESNVNPSTITTLLAGTRKDMASSSADAIRAAMRRIEAEAQADKHPSGSHTVVQEGDGD